MPRLSVDSLRVSIAGKRLIDGLSLEVSEGECVNLAGPSGAGKTLTLRAIATLMEADAGQLTLDGKAPRDLGFPAWRRKVVYVAQRPVMFDGSVSDNLQRAFSYRSAQGAFDARAARALLERLGIADRLDQPARTLSVGEQQRVALVRSLLVGPDVLLLDEPTSALDPEATSAVETLIRESGKGILLVTHDAALSERLSARRVPLA